MLKSVMFATAAVAIAGSSLVYAQQRAGGDSDGGPRLEQRHWPSAEDMAAFTDARIAALKAGLELTPDQAKNWPPFEQALRDLAQLRAERMQARAAAEQQAVQAEPSASPFDRLARRADAMAKTSAALKRMADTGAPLYQSLTEAQKNRFRILAHFLRPHHHMLAGGEGYGRGWHEQHGYSGDGERGHWWWKHGFDQDGRGGRMHHMMNSDEPDSKL